MFPFGYPSINPKAIVDEVKPVEDKDQKKPYACLKKRDNQSYCGREVYESREYMFNDATYAMKFYNKDSRGPVWVCNRCAECARYEGIGAGMNDTAPMALRGIKENNK